MKQELYIILLNEMYKSKKHNNYNKYCEIHYQKYNMLFYISLCKCINSNRDLLNCHILVFLYLS